MSIVLLGIKNCDTVKKAQRWLTSNNIEYRFRDFRADPLSREELEQWVNVIGLAALVNKRSTSYRQLTEQQKASNNESQWIECLLQAPTLIKRPVLLHQQGMCCGFKAADYEELFSEQ